MRIKKENHVGKLGKGKGKRGKRALEERREGASTSGKRGLWRESRKGSCEGGEKVLEQEGGVQGAFQKR